MMMRYSEDENEFLGFNAFFDVYLDFLEEPEQILVEIILFYIKH